MGKMKQPRKRELKKLKYSVQKESEWEEVKGFKGTKPTSIRFSPDLIKGLEQVASLRGERSYQTLLKRWVAERLKYEMEIIELVRKKAG